MPKDLRSFIAALEGKFPDEVARVTKPIAPRYEITALLTQLEKQKRLPLLICENVEGSEAPVVINVQASRKLMALALQCKPEELAAKFTERQGKPIRRWKSTKRSFVGWLEAPCADTHCLLNRFIVSFQLRWLVFSLHPLKTAT